MDLNLWKDKDELKLFLNNLGIEYRYGCFEQKDPKVCHLLGDYFLSIDKMKDKAAQVYQSNCDESNFGLSCDAYGRMLFMGQVSGEPETRKALQYFTKGCDLNEYRACYHAGQMLGGEDPKVRKQIPYEPDQALKMLNKACLSRQVASACTLIHLSYLKGLIGNPRDMQMARKYGLLACDQNEIMGCFNLSIMYRKGDGVEVDKEKSAYYNARFKEISRGIKKTQVSNSEPDL